MTFSSKYQLFISDKCCCCDTIIDHLKKENISIETINITTEDYELPFSLLIFPALVKEKKLICYGTDDIIKYLKKN